MKKSPLFFILCTLLLTSCTTNSTSENNNSNLDSNLNDQTSSEDINHPDENENNGDNEGYIEPDYTKEDDYNIYLNDIKLPTHQGLYNPIEGAEYYASPKNYYYGIDPSLNGIELVKALSTLTSHDFEPHSYSSLPQIYQYSDLSHGKMRMIYTGTEKTFSPGSMPSGTNKEHVWCASWYGTGNRETGAGSPGADAHNIWPCCGGLNSKRGTCAYDELDFATSYKCPEFGSYSYADETKDDSFVYSTASGKSNGQNDDIMYPAKGHRGEIARILMYVATRYHNDPTYPVMMHDKPETLKIGRIGKLSTLLKWHYQEPPTHWEMRRNDVIAELWHHNRNPFIDHPEYATLIYSTLPEPGHDAPTQEVLNVISQYGQVDYAKPTSIELDTNNTVLAKDESYKIPARVLPQDAKQVINYSSDDENIATVTNAGVITAKSKGTAHITLSCIDNSAIQATFTCEVKELESIEVSGQANKLIYDAGEKFDPTGLKVIGYYNDQTTFDIDPFNCKWLDPSDNGLKLKEGSTYVICSYNGKTCSYEGIIVNPHIAQGYERVNENLTDYSGRYLLVSEDAKVILDGNSNEYGKTNSSYQTSVEIINNTINEDLEHKEFIIEKDGAGYTIKSMTGYFIGTNGNGNLNCTNKYINEITFKNNEISIKCDNCYLRYNTQGGNFRYYKENNGNIAGLPVALYKAM